MHFEELNEGDYRVYAGAVEGRMQDGYVAAVVINRLRGVQPAPKEAFRDMSLAFGHRWATAEEALFYALNTAQQLIRKEPRRLAC